MQSNMNKRIIFVLSFLMTLFVLLVLYLTYFQIVKADKIANNEYNKRLWVDEKKLERGTIYDRDKNVLVETKKDQSGKNYRFFDYANIYAAITGYNSKTYGTAGLEKSYMKELLNVNKDTPLSQLRNIVSSKNKGNDLVLTTNSKLQKLAYNLLEGKKGSVVMMNPKTGEVYVMATYPSYNPNEVSSQWQDLLNKESSPLLNRSTQGMYTPGSVFKIITATAVLNNKDKVDKIVEDNTGTIEFNKYTISNNNGSVFGETDLRKALEKSSNVYFASQGVKLGNKILTANAQNFMIGKKIPFDLPVAPSVNGYMKTKSNADIATTSFGQGETLVTPLNMAMAMSAVANDGVMLKPYLVNQVIDCDGKVIKQTKPEQLSEVGSKKDMEILKDYLRTTAESYETLNVSTSVIAKSGTAEIKDKTSTHAWFVAAAPFKNPKFAIAVILEDDNSYGVRTAGPIASKMLNAAINEIGFDDKN